MDTNKIIMQIIRKHCLECVCGSPMEVELYTSENCAPYPYRSEKDSKPNLSRLKIMPGNNTGPFSNTSTSARKKSSIESTNKARVGT